jgi:hypothetical protein
LADRTSYGTSGPKVLFIAACNQTFEARWIRFLDAMLQQFASWDAFQRVRPAAKNARGEEFALLGKRVKLESKS